jgi:SAM-dependent methyltransferase
MPFDVFDTHAERYDRWYDEHEKVYRKELALIRRYRGAEGADLEIGVGTGRFAEPLGIRLGLDPSLPMLRIARSRGVEAIRGLAEALPFMDASLESVLIMTSLCYFDDPWLVLREISRVLAPGGGVIIGFLGKGGEIAERYLHTPEKGPFLAHATFYAPEEVIAMLASAGFMGIEREVIDEASVKGFHVITAQLPEKEPLLS